MKFRELLLVLHHHRVDHLVIGGVAAVLRGAPLSTFDLDIVHERSEANVTRLLAALDELDAQYRDLTGRGLRPTRDRLVGDGHHLLRTKLGPLDVLGTVIGDESYESLLPRCEPLALNGGTVPVLSIDALIEIKRRLGRPKDRIAVEILEQYRRR